MTQQRIRTIGKVTIARLASGYRSSNALNNDLELIEEAFDNTLSRDGTGPNQMEAPLDMNNNQILNVPEPVSDTDIVRKIDVQDIAVTFVTDEIIELAETSGAGAGATAGTTAGTAAANVVVAGKANTAADNISSATWRTALGLLDPAIQNIALSAVEISPEDFYLPADAGDWSPAFARLETFRQAFPNTGTRLIRVALRKNRYYVKSPINLKVGANHSLFMDGAGYLLDGSRIEAVVGWTGGTTPVLTIEGDSGPSTTGQFSLRNFAVVQVESTGPAESGVVVKNLNGAAGGSPVRDLYIQGFKYPLTTTNARLIQWDRVYIWSRSLANVECIRVMSDGPGTFGGDMTFNECQTVTGISGSYTANGSVGIGLYANNGGETRGVRFNSYIGYHADTPVKMRATAGATAGGIIADIWFNPGCQFDQTVVRMFDIQATNVGALYGTIFSVFFLGCYWSTNIGAHGISIITGTRGSANQIDANSGNVADFHLAHCRISNFSKNLFITGGVSLHITDNDWYGIGDPGVSLDSIIILSDCHNSVVRGNVTRAKSGTIGNALRVLADCTGLDIGPWTGETTLVVDDGFNLRPTIWGRPKIPGPLNVFADRAAAITGGLVTGDVYETSIGALMHV